ncbi:MAG: phosphate ABC transporter permease PstA [Lachnospiraceae bacterium]|nr:phosphate ABC transporter permease PstA [Lachnospiraceae bacterium]MDY4971349.1 phosphate ABC transporter permease PstA [Lachnospiraceae bacterium]
MRRKSDMIVRGIINLCALISVLILVGILGYVFVRGIRTVTPSFLLNETSVLNGTTGIAGNILNTLFVIVITLLFAAPIGIGSAIYLNEYAKPGKLVRMIEFTTETLSGIPSIIFGLFGFIFFGSVLKLGYSILTGSLTMTLMVLPLITRNTQEALKTVPDSYRTGALGMGAEKWYMIRTILLPAAMPGIITGIILAIGRIVGESAALLFTAGSGYALPKTAGAFFDKIFQSGGTMTIQMYLSMQNGEYEIAFGIAVVLLILVLLINFLTHYLSSKFDVSKKK